MGRAERLKGITWYLRLKTSGPPRIARDLKAHPVAERAETLSNAFELAWLGKPLDGNAKNEDGADQPIALLLILTLIPARIMHMYSETPTT